MSINDTYNITSVFHDVYNGLTSSSIPNWITIVIEIVIGVGLALVFLHLQRKTEGALLRDIKKYTDDDVKEHETVRRKYYIKRIKEILNQIREQDIVLKEFIIEYKKGLLTIQEYMF